MAGGDGLSKPMTGRDDRTALGWGSERVKELPGLRREYLMNGVVEEGYKGLHRRGSLREGWWKEAWEWEERGTWKEEIGFEERW